MEKSADFEKLQEEEKREFAPDLSKKKVNKNLLRSYMKKDKGVEKEKKAIALKSFYHEGESEGHESSDLERED